MTSREGGTSALEAKLRETLESVHAQTPKNPGWLLCVRRPTRGLDFHAATGVDPNTGEALQPEATFRIASVTKTFTAAATLRLVEQGHLGLDTPIAPLLPAPYPALLSRGGYDPLRITVRHLLTHTSSLIDYAKTPEYEQAVIADIHHRWTREEQVRFALALGPPAGAPGEVFAYSDTGYNLLGALLEVKTGKDLAVALRSLNGFEALGLSATWLETVEPVPPGAPARAPQQFYGVPLIQVDASVDLWGGGGLVSTTRELESYYRALFEGRVFTRPETLQTMLTLPASNTSEHMAMGIVQLLIDGVRCWHHEGSWGATAFFCPEFDLGISATLLAARPHGQEIGMLMKSVFRALRGGGENPD